MVDFGQLRVILGFESAAFKAGITDAKNSLVSWRDETNKSTGEMAKWGAAIGLTIAPVAALGYELANLTNQAAAFGKTIKDNARDLGLSTDQYQRWTHAAIAAGSSAEEIVGSIRMMSIRLKDAVDPTSDVARYLTAMGVSALDANGKLRPMNDVLLDILPALNALPEGMDRNQAAMVLFGRSFSNIADLTSLTRQELQALMDQAPVFSDEKIQKMDEMAVKTALLNEQIQIMSVDLGEDLIPLAQDLIGVFEELGPVIESVAGVLHEAATGTTMMVQGMQLLYTQWRYGMESPEMKALQERVQVYAQSEFNERSGYVDMTSAGYADARRRFAGRGLTLAPLPTKATTATEETPSVPTYNTMFASSLGPEGVGPDWAGFSALANLSREELQKMASGDFALTKGSKATQEKAAEYLARMGTGAGAATTPKTTSDIKDAKKTPLFGTDEITKTTEKELNAQEKLYNNFFKVIQEGLVTTSELQAEYWANLTGNQSLALTSMMQADAAFTKFVAENPTIKNIGVVVWTKQGADWDPTANEAFMQTARVNAIISNIPKLVTPDFKAISMRGGAGTGTQAGTTKNDVTVNVKVNVDKNGDATASADSTTTAMQQAGMGG